MRMFLGMPVQLVGVDLQDPRGSDEWRKNHAKLMVVLEMLLASRPWLAQVQRPA